MRYNDANTYFKNRFGTKLYKVAISVATTCPNRDGTCGVGGCSFCSGGGSGEFAESYMLPVTDQINRGIERLKRKTNENTRYIAYFQSFTSTYCDYDILKNALEEASNHPLVSAISIATRPDSISDEVLALMSDINRKIPLFVELGLQTYKDETAKHFNRGYLSSVYETCVGRLKSVGINVITHIIFGLPDETEDDMMRSVQYSVDAGTDGVKFTCLYILSGTRMESLYQEGKVVPLQMEEYFDIVDKALEILPENIVVHRLTGDGPKNLLVAPMWTSNKRSVINYINKRFG